MLASLSADKSYDAGTPDIREQIKMALPTALKSVLAIMQTAGGTLPLP
jgi:hypothetical protein